MSCSLRCRFVCSLCSWQACRLRGMPTEVLPSMADRLSKGERPTVREEWGRWLRRLIYGQDYLPPLHPSRSCYLQLQLWAKDHADCIILIHLAMTPRRSLVIEDSRPKETKPPQKRATFRTTFSGPSTHPASFVPHPCVRTTARYNCFGSGDSTINC